MKKMKKILSMLLCALLALSMTAGCVAESVEATETPAATEAPATVTLPDASAVVATVNGVDITWGDCQEVYDMLVAEYGSYYDLTVEENVKLFEAVAMAQMVDEQLVLQKATELGLAPLTDDEIASLKAEADATWEEALQNYVDYYAAEDATDEDKATLREQAVAYYASLGYSQESVEENTISSEIYNRLFNYFTKDAAETDEEVQTYYNSLVTADRELYENDLEGYCTAVSEAEMMAYYNYMYTGEYSVEYPHYKPAGFRAVKHILLSVDETLMNNYTELEASYEEQQNTDDTTTDTAEATAAPVTLEQVEAARQAILDSVADKVQEIKDAYAAGTDFDTLIANYSTDGGTTYEVCAYSTNYVTPFVTAAMSIKNIGELSDPTVSDYGVHIVLYVDDVPAGAVELTSEEFEELRTSLLEDKQSELYSAGITTFQNASTITYTGVVPTYEELTANEDTTDDTTN